MDKEHNLHFLSDSKHDGGNCKYVKKKLLGRGQFGEAWLVERVSDGQHFVCKEMKLDKMSSRDKMYAASEIKCIEICDHPCIIGYVEDIETDDSIFIVMEYADGGDLEKHLIARSADQKYFQEHEVVFMFLQLCMALYHVHNNHMLHRDLKSANVFIHSTGILTLGDFGFSHVYEETVSADVGVTFLGTPYYLAPELWKNKKYSKKADVWALGIILYELLSLHRPYNAKGMKDLMNKVLFGSYTPIPSHYSPAMADLVKSILVLDPQKRPSIVDIFNIPYVKNGLMALKGVIERNTKIPDSIKERLNLSIDDSLKLNSAAHCGDVCQIKKDVTHAGFVMRMGGKGKVWKERYLQLKDGMIYLSDGPDDANAKGLSLEEVHNACQVHLATAKKDFVFAVNTTGGKSMWMQATNQKDMYKWIHSIQLACGFA